MNDGSSNNTIRGNSIGTDASGRSSKSFDMGDYGVLLFNSANNAIAKSTRSNRVVGSGIANLREFTGRGATSRSGKTKTPAAAGEHPSNPSAVPSGPRRFSPVRKATPQADTRIKST